MTLGSENHSKWQVCLNVQKINLLIRAVELRIGIYRTLVSYIQTLCAMPMRKLLLTISGILIWTSGQACDCDRYVGNFQTTSKWAEFVFIVKVTGHSYFKSVTTAGNISVSVPTAATFEIVETLKGTIDKSEITVFGDKGNLCRPYIDVFKQDKYYIVGLYRCDGKEQNETTDDFQISGCGEFWIEYNPESKTATGLIKNKRKKPTTVTIETLKELMRKG